jgi:vacuolar-type H+-ATPase subunit E/Vma4
LTFPEPVYEIICGDLYDVGTGKGLFVVQGSGDDRQRGNSVYLKPVATKGMSNLFVTTGEKGKHTYNFDLEIVPLSQAHRVVNVLDPAGTQPAAAGGTSSTPENGPGEPANKPIEGDARRAESEQQARRQADEIIRQARQQADRIIGEAEAKVIETNRQSSQRGEQEAQRRFVQALLLGIREVKVNTQRTTIKKVIIALDPRIVVLEEKAYLRYTIQNTGDREFIFAAIGLERISGAETETITIEVNQSKPENKLDPGEVMAGVIVFDSKLLTPKDKLMLFIRSEENAELTRVTIQ